MLADGLSLEISHSWEMSLNWNDLKDEGREGNQSGKDEERVVLMQGEMGLVGGGLQYLRRLQQRTLICLTTLVSRTSQGK